MVNFKKSRDLVKLYNWACHIVTWYWSADTLYWQVSIGNFQYTWKVSLATRLRGHKQRKLNVHVYSFLLFVSSRPHYQAEFYYSKSGLLTITWMPKIKEARYKPRVHFSKNQFFCWSMAAILRDSVAVMRTRTQAIPLATTRKSIHGFSLLSYIGIECQAGAPL